MKKLLGILVLGLLWCNVVFAGTVIGGVALPCGMLVKSNDEYNFQRIGEFKQAILGMISGINSTMDTNAGSGMNEMKIFKSVLNICRKDKSRSVSQATQDFYFILMKQ